MISMDAHDSTCSVSPRAGSGKGIELRPSVEALLVLVRGLSSSLDEEDVEQVASQDDQWQEILPAHPS